MKPSRNAPSGMEDLFRSRLENIIDLRHELVGLAAAIDWGFFDGAKRRATPPMRPSIRRRAAPALRRG